MAPWPLSDAGQAANGVFISTSTVNSSMTLISLSGAEANAVTEPTFPASRFILTAAALNGSPLWNLTPWRSFSVHTVASALGVADSASQGAGWPSEFTFMSGSKTLLVTYEQASGQEASGMNQPELFSASRPMDSEPPGT